MQRWDGPSNRGDLTVSIITKVVPISSGKGFQNPHHLPDALRNGWGTPLNRPQITVQTKHTLIQDEFGEAS